jgi:N6-L-threonylcarbamoyladenine synthase
MQPVLKSALDDAECTMKEIDAIAVTHAPGLLGSLLVGNVAARTLSWIHDKPLVGVHHTLGHLTSPWLDLPEGIDPVFPILTLSASGGHTDLWLRTSHTHGILLGQTRDDAAGEAFDKGATLMGLPYPGGPAIAKTAHGGDHRAFAFPLPLAGDGSFDWSFSGLKTSLRYLLRDDPSAMTRLPDLAASFEYAVCRHLIDRVQHALSAHANVRELHLVGGVSANTRLRDMAQSLGIVVRWPSRHAFCTDNGAMIAAAAHHFLLEDPRATERPFNASPTSPLSLR